MSTLPGWTLDSGRLLKHGRPHRAVSAAIHYFRVHPALWRDRLERLRAMGCNAVEVYVAWNFHQPAPDVFDFEGWRDLGAFVRLGGDLGLDVIVRPGPYICAEWDFGGLPAWLLAEESTRLRTSDPAFLRTVDAWFDALVPVLVPLQASHGGPVVAVQVENEYGSYGSDKAYLEHLRRGLAARGVDAPLFTSDGPTPRMLAGGTLPGVWATVNFGSRPAEAFAALRAARPGDPVFCMEFWNGWFDHFGEPHHRRDPAEAAAVLDTVLAEGASVNIYMGHGGTNFGWWAGANHTGRREGDPGYQPTVTSYDYDAPVGEAGELTPKFHAFREVIARHLQVPGHQAPPRPARVTPQSVAARPVAALRDVLDRLGPEPVRRPTPEPMEKLGFTHGLVHYRHRVDGPPGPAELRVDGVRDLAQVFADGRLVGTLERDLPDATLPLDVPDAGLELEILVEPLGRVNYGPLLADRKGLIGGVRLDHQFLHGWDIRVLTLDDLGGLVSGPVKDRTAAAEGPRFHRATVTLDRTGDAFVAVPDAERCLVWVNGFLLGRLWNRGPQRTLYAPGPLWHSGDNDVVVLDLVPGPGLNPLPGLTVGIRDEPDLGPVAPPPVVY